MDAEGGAGAAVAMSPEGHAVFAEGINMVLGRWTALQMAIQNGWGGQNSLQKVEELANDILSWFCQSKPPLYIDDLEILLDENLLLSFNAEIEDGSIEEVAEQLMIMHEDCLHGNYESIEKLRISNPVSSAVSQSKQVTAEDEDDSSDEEGSDMMVDEPKPKEIVVDKQKLKEMPDDEGWSVIATRRNRGRRTVELRAACNTRSG